MVSEDEPLSESDIHALRRMVPYQNVFWLRNLFDEVEESIAE